MIRSLAALFAKKTAIVAITGVTVIGGATFALGAVGDAPEETVVAASADDCTEEEVWDGDLEQCVAGLEVPADCDPGLVLDPETDTCVPDPDVPADCDPGLVLDPETDTCVPDPDAPTDCDPGLVLDPETDTCVPDPDAPADCDPASLSEGETCPDDEGQDTEGDELTSEETEGDDVVAEHPENHGKYVSEAAKDCHDVEGMNHGQCVREVAQSDVGKKGAEESAPADELVVDEAAPEEPAAAALTEEPKGKPDHAGPPAGKGGKGKGGKG